MVALCMAPWLTMVTRNPAAGAFFSVSISAMLMIFGAWLGIRVHGYTREADVFQLRFMWWTLGLLSVAAAIHGSWMFAHLQAIEGGGKAIHLRLGRRDTALSPTAVRGDVYWLLIKKELRLQQLAWVVALIYAGIYVVAVVSRRNHNDADNIATLVTVIYGLIQSMLIGALASAEERHNGVHDAQLLLPLSSARQWAVKAGSAIAHAEILTLLLPLTLLFMVPIEGFSAVSRRGPIHGEFVVMVAALTSVSLYVSALTSSGLRALMLSIPAVFAVIWFVQRIEYRVSWAAYKFVWVRGDTPMTARAPFVPIQVWLEFGAVMLATLILWRALPHYRWNDSSMTRVAADAALVAAAIVVYFAVSGALGVR